MRLALISLCFLWMLCTFQGFGQSLKMNGVSFVAGQDSINSSHVQPVVDVGASHAAVMPFGFMRSLSDPQLNFDSPHQWYGEQTEGLKQYIGVLRDHGLRIMIKPQIWVFHGAYTGHIHMEDEDSWRTFERRYTDFILTHARTAAALKADLFCIGTEMQGFVEARPDYWLQLIDSVRSIYDGAITYAANWDEYRTSPFWGRLDYIGVDAYFPITDQRTPSVSDCVEGWQQHYWHLRDVALQHGKQLIFTEYGYRSVDYTAREPWRSDFELSTVNMEAQYNATKGLYEVFWAEDWFAGGYIWKWFYNYNQVGGPDDHQFTPQRKPVEALIKKVYTAGVE